MKKQVTVQLSEDVFGTIKPSEIAMDPVEHPGHVLKVGDEVEAKVMSASRKTRQVVLSIRALEAQEQKQALKEYAKQGSESVNTSLGDLLKESMDTAGNDEDKK